MRTISKQVASAFNNGYSFNSQNTKVELFAEYSFNNKTFYDARVLKLHGNVIAVYNSKHGLYITNCGYFTNVTKDRLNCINGVTISQSKGKWYLNGNEWDGTPIKVKG